MTAPANPFPGWNPYFQHRWGDVHTRLINYISDALSEELPSDLVARAQERVAVAEEEKPHAHVPDVAVVEQSRDGFPPVWTPEGAEAGGLAVAEPLVFVEERPTERWLEIRDVHGELITAIELLSPANKSGKGGAEYGKRQDEFLHAGVNLVEIDLIRGGEHVVDIERAQLTFPAGTCHLICVARATFPSETRREVYLCPLREPLPTFRVPLRYGDPDIALALQPLVDRCWRFGRYWLENYARDLQPPVALEDAGWVGERLRAVGL